jgi:hypothetical protein
MNTITENGAALIAAQIIEKIKGDFSVPPKWLKLNQAVRYSNPATLNLFTKSRAARLRSGIFLYLLKSITEPMTASKYRVFPHIYLIMALGAT